MPNFSKASLGRLASCEESLQRIFTEVVQHFDCAVLVGYRGKMEQDEAYEKGLSKLMFPMSKHNSMFSRAADVCPYPIDWKDTKRFIYFAGFVMGVAANMGIKLRWGGDWRSDNHLDQSFMDLVHFELTD